MEATEAASTIVVDAVEVAEGEAVTVAVVAVVAVVVAAAASVEATPPTVAALVTSAVRRSPLAREALPVVVAAAFLDPVGPTSAGMRLLVLAKKI